MTRRPTVRILAALAVAAFVAANGLTASGLHGLAHTSDSTMPVERMAHAEHGDHAAAGHVGEVGHADAGHGHDHGSPVECSCFGTCAGGSASVAPSERGEMASLDEGEDSSVVSTGDQALQPRLTAYLFPLPNAPPVRA